MATILPSKTNKEMATDLRTLRISHKKCATKAVYQKLLVNHYVKEILQEVATHKAKVTVLKKWVQNTETFGFLMSLPNGITE